MPPLPPRALATAMQRVEKLANAAAFEAAIAESRRLVAANPQAAQVRMQLAQTLESAGQFDGARKVLRETVDSITNPKMASIARRALADLCLRMSDFDAAHDVIDAGLRADPGAGPLAAARATVLIEQRRLDDAEKTLNDAASAGMDHAELAVIRSRLRLRQGAFEQGATEVQAFLASSQGPPQIRRMLLGSLADLLDKAERFDDAMHAYDQAAQLSARNFDPDKHDRTIDALIKAWSSKALSKAPRSKSPNERPVFILGMPRTGTSLLERIIGAHPGVSAGGELNALPAAWRIATPKSAPGSMFSPEQIAPKAIADSANTLRAEIARVSQDAARVTDKNPLNFFRVGLIPLIAPGARIIHTLRDPRDTCLSCYFVRLHSHHAYANDLTHLGRYYQSYRRVMDHWQEALPAAGFDTPMLEVRYPDLVSDPETQTRRVIDFLGLDWNDACLRPHEAAITTWTASRDQVTKPINTSAVNRYRNYEAHLGPLLESLGPYADGIDPEADSG